MSAQTAADLRAAAEVLRRDGWTQGAYRGARGSRCASDALCVVTGSTHQAEVGAAYERAMAAALALASATGARAVWLWNDTPGRTADEVIAALLAAADAVEADQ